ncbi:MULTISPECIES: aldose 1-epimerase [unclassified Pseudomonas]|uniref:aldose 1-epimerase n=1 Tax=unclassified Pseudomonas TaxID=196821 RepID=UPI000A0BB44C|nr:MULTISPECIES: aldose 1-epimerase [unclassified Pseudomonas]SMF66231.1 aldose 1-epimerase [Pseudomonas sp. LAIL14HWK12:I11]SMR81711.1 aldose 1-epimerase [Pseudomonas sp. LAIL14HWK12:I10]SOD08337.1 aldose 1-epimerase [Pseudomonas sp. LAIL14HWK12:I8]
MQPLVLSNATWSVGLLPAWGGRIAHLRAEGLDVLLPISAEHFDPLDWPRAGAYPLVPYSNRIRNAQLQFAGQAYTLPTHPAARPHTLHGVAHTLAWHVLEPCAGQLTLACDYQGEHWPWAFRAEQRFVLEGNRLSIVLALLNQGDSPMPAGLGLHPYFQRHAGLKVRYQVGREWQIDDQYLATGGFRQATQPVSIDADDAQALAHYQSCWDGLLELDYPAGSLKLQASPPLSHFVAFAPAGSRYLCLEPVSHLANAFNQPEQAWGDTGTQVLGPGQRLEATLEFTWQRR